jgi:hypothetical protein
VANVDGFALQVEKFAELLGLVPDKDLAAMNDDELGRVVEFCSFGFPGAWAPKITKAGALFRPRAIPILDGYLALAFGYSRDGFPQGLCRADMRLSELSVLWQVAYEIGENTG